MIRRTGMLGALAVALAAGISPLAFGEPRGSRPAGRRPFDASDLKRDARGIAADVAVMKAATQRAKQLRRGAQRKGKRK